MTDTPNTALERVSLEDRIEALLSEFEVFPYRLELMRLVDGEHTYTLTIPGEETTEHSEHDLAYERIAEVRRRRRKEAITALLQSAPPPSPEGWQPTHRHVKSGGYYQVLQHGQDITNHRGDKGVEVVIYRGVGGHIWVREATEFNDGRFEALSPSIQGEGDGKGSSVAGAEALADAKPMSADFVDEMRERLMNIADSEHLKGKHTHFGGEIRSMARIVRTAALCFGRPAERPTPDAGPSLGVDQ